MAAFTQNISNTVTVLALSTTKWGLFNWGEEVWGTGGKAETRFIKAIANSQDTTFDRTGGAFVKSTFSIGELLPTFSAPTNHLRDGAGLWEYVLEPNRTYAEASQVDVTFVCQAARGTSWSEA